MQKRVEYNQVSADAAVEKLRKRIDNYKLRHLRTASRGTWIAIKVVIIAVILMFVEFFIFNPISPTLFFVAFLVVDALLIIGGVVEFRKHTKAKPAKGSVLIGKSFAHYTQSGNRDNAVEVGADGEHYIDYLHQPNHHVLINGSTSSGKTATLLTFAARISMANNINFLMLDWNGENEEWAKRVGATVWKIPENFKINLFKLNGLSKESRASVAVENLVVAARLTALQSTKVKSSLLRFYMEGTEPTVYDLWSALCGREAGKANVLNQRLRAIQRVIGYEPEEFWNGIFKRNNLVSLTGLNESEKSLVVYAIIQRLAELFDKRPELRKEPRLMVILDEAWQFFKREKEFDNRRESSLEKVVRLGRKYGFGLVVSTQQVDDVPKVFINSCSLLMFHQQRESSYMGRDILNLEGYEAAYLNAAAQGEMLLFDRGMTQKGQWWSDYVKVEPLSNGEIKDLSAKHEAYAPAKIDEPEMPIEVHDSEPSSPDADSGIKGIRASIDMPSTAVYRFMVALNRTGSLAGAHKLLREKGWLTSLTSLYGDNSKPSILDRAASSRYATKEGKMTAKGLNVIGTEELIGRQGIRAGSEEHKELMRKIIRKIQDSGNFAFTLPDKDSFDVGEIKAKTKSDWDLENLTIYECQTNAIKEELEKCVARSKRLNAELIFTVLSKEIAEAIIKATEDNYRVVVV